MKFKNISKTQFLVGGVFRASDTIFEADESSEEVKYFVVRNMILPYTTADQAKESKVSAPVTMNENSEIGGIVSAQLMGEASIEQRDGMVDKNGFMINKGENPDLVTTQKVDVQAALDKAMDDEVKDLSSEAAVISLEKADSFKDVIEKDEAESMQTTMVEGDREKNDMFDGKFIEKNQAITREVVSGADKADREVAKMASELTQAIEDSGITKTSKITDTAVQIFLTQSFAKQKFDILQCKDIDFLKLIFNSVDDIVLKELLSQRLSEIAPGMKAEGLSNSDIAIQK